MSRERMIALFSIAVNLVVAVAVIWAVFTRFPTTGGDAKKMLDSAKTFRFFTTDSNLLSALSCLCILPFVIKIAVTGEGSIPLWVQIFKYVGTCSVTLTFLTVVVFLGPTQGYGAMFSGANLWLHLICPLLCMISYLLTDCPTKTDWKTTFFGMLPVVIYGAVYIVAVLLIGESNGGWEDFYGFNRGGKWFVSLPLMLGGGYAIAYGEWTLANLTRGLLK